MPRVKNLLFLGYNENETRLINSIKSKGINVKHSNKKLSWTDEFDLVISFGYRHIIGLQQIKLSTAPILNLHISYLPWNKGAHPNFWSHFDSTPSGVSIHLIDRGIDTGPIAFQKYVNFSRDEITFEQTYARLILEIENLLLDNLDDILDFNYQLRPQRRQGTYHKAADLPPEFVGWHSIIYDEINRIDSLLYNQDHDGKL